MNIYQIIFLIIFGAFNLIFSIWGVHQSKNKANTYGITWALFPIGIFVWGDAVIFGLFWSLVSFFTLVIKDWILFLLIFSVFWLVRSLGETIFFFSQQFSTVMRQPPETLIGYKIFKGKGVIENDAIWFITQIIQQCITVISIIASIYLTYLWLQ